MLTPVFRITQDDGSLRLVIRAPFAKISDTEIEYDGNEFVFTSKPYFLRLYLPNDVIDDETGTAEYDSEKGEFLVIIPKKNKGEHFANLEMISLLLRPSGSLSAAPLIEETNLIEQSAPAPEPTISDDAVIRYGYGFANKRYGVFTHLQAEVGELVEISNPDMVRKAERFAMCHQTDIDRFNRDHYLADLYDDCDGGLGSALNYRLSSNDEELTTLSFDDRDRMKDLVAKRIYENMSEHDETAIGYGLVDILFAYLYDLRTTDGEHTVESGWTICKLSATLSYLVAFGDMKSTMICAIRRSICYPLYRHWRLSMLVLDDLKRIVSLGRLAVLKCLLDVHRIMAISGQYRYIMNDLYVTDYCMWIQCLRAEVVLHSITEQLQILSIEKNSIEMDLSSDNDDELETHFDRMQLNRGDIDSDDDDEENSNEH